MKKILSIMSMALLMAGCTDDYKDWAQPFQNGPEEPVSASIIRADSTMQRILLFMVYNPLFLSFQSDTGNRIPRSPKRWADHSYPR